VIGSDQVLWSAPETERAGRPLLLLLHGHGMTEQVGFELRHRLPPELVVAAIRGPLRAKGGYSWFPLDATLRLHQIDDVASQILRWLDDQVGFGSVGILGFSQGSAVAIQCMRLQPLRFACGVVLSGFVVPAPVQGDFVLATRKPPIFSGRGADDRLVPQLLVTATDSWLEQHATLTRRTYAGLGHTVTDQEISDLARFLDDHLVQPAKSETA
jgi:phospholipase/carboxylesterase